MRGYTCLHWASLNTCSLVLQRIQRIQNYSKRLHRHRVRCLIERHNNNNVVKQRARCYCRGSACIQVPICILIQVYILHIVIKTNGISLLVGLKWLHGFGLAEIYEVPRVQRKYEEQFLFSIARGNFNEIYTQDVTS